jgi:rubredoxin
LSLTPDPESGIAPTTTYQTDGISWICTEATVTCNFGNGASGSMKFNKGAVNADAAPVAISTHTLFCQDDGIFGFTQNGASTAVMEVTCSKLKKCATCKVSQLSLTPDPESGITPTTTTPTAGSNGCTEMTVTCNFGADSTGSMKFNQGAVNADITPVAVSIHKLICQKDGTFGFTQNGVTTNVTEVACKKNH